jgi:flagellar basal body L-ring protein FlgH
MLVLDRFEGEYALIEMNRRIFHIPKILLPKSAKEGDVITIQITVDKEATAKQKQSADKLSGELFEG